MKILAEGSNPACNQRLSVWVVIFTEFPQACPPGLVCSPGQIISAEFHPHLSESGGSFKNHVRWGRLDFEMDRFDTAVESPVGLLHTGKAVPGKMPKSLQALKACPQPPGGGRSPSALVVNSAYGAKQPSPKESAYTKQKQLFLFPLNLQRSSIFLLNK